MAGPRRSKRLESCSKPDQEKVAKIARVSNDQKEVVPGQNTKMGESAVEGPSDSGVDRTSPKDASPNRASEEAPKRELRDEEWLKASMQQSDLALAEYSKWMDEGLVKFRQAIQRDVGFGYRQGDLFEEWESLVAHIQHFTVGAGYEDLPWDRLDEAVKQRFISYSSCAQQLFETSIVRRFMFERWIWEIIDENFFTGKSRDIEWTSPYWEAQAAMERFLREKNFRYDDEDLRFQYPNWRFTTINFYYSLKLRNDRLGEFVREARIEPRCVVKILKKALGQYFPENPNAFLERKISTLANLIAEYELILDCGRQDLQLVFHDPNTNKACGFPFSARAEGFDTQVVMKSVGTHGEAENNGLPIELVVSPMLVFYGAKDGWDYHVPAVAFPMQVGEGEEVKIIKDKEGGTKDEDEDEDEECNSSLDFQLGLFPLVTMALQPCRFGLWRSSHAARTLIPCVRTYATDSTPESFKTKTKTPSSSGVVPRWSQTPAAMKAPLQLDWAKNPQNKVWTVNNDPKKLDEVYERLLGPGGSKLLPEELKWLAVTHKSFDQGRRGFNDRLALLGRMALVMETTKTIVAQGPSGTPTFDDGFDRQPFVHPNLQSVDNLSVKGPKDVVGKERLSGLAAEVGLIDVVRWKPKQVQKLRASGADVVLNGAIMAIIGAITLQHGAVVASQVIRERILSRLQD
ncbi:RNase III domain-containing protein [Fusarium mundagurra]|uniref:RNase III domain-containing protein n=1 Tax=Fusarium mundagurra TaxID=1567541 RepID=A0A8H5Y8Y5_9HYPO|nr:RNase III domain-containing protein [Fusarium mundagurra]